MCRSSHTASRGRVLWAEGMAGAKALRWEALAAIQELGGHVVCVILRCGRSKKFEFYFFNKIKCIVVCVVKGL